MRLTFDLCFEKILLTKNGSEREIYFYRTATKSFCKRSSMLLEADKLNKRKRLIPIRPGIYLRQITMSSSWRTRILIFLINTDQRVYKKTKVSLQGKNHSTILLREKQKRRAGIEPRTPWPIHTCWAISCCRIYIENALPWCWHDNIYVVRKATTCFIQTQDRDNDPWNNAAQHNVRHL